MDIESRNTTDSNAPSPSPGAARILIFGLPIPLPERVRWGGLIVDLFLVALLAVGVYFRFSWTNWNQDTDLHPDEYGLTGTLTRLAIPGSIGDYFNTRLSPISPYNKYDESGQQTANGPDNRMRWGQWPLVLIRWTAEQTGDTGYRELRLSGRRLSALADVLALIVVYFIGRRLYRHRVGLLAAALGGLAVMQIQQSHFMTVDTFAVLFSALAMYCAIRVAQEKPGFSEKPGFWRSGWLWYVLFGVFCGMAVASRINLVVLFGMILVAALIAHADEWGKGKADLMAIGIRLALAGVAMLITFRVTQPMSFRAEKGDTTIFTIRPNPDWVDSMRVAQAESSGVGGGPPGEQWTNRPALVFPFVNIVLWGMGLPLGLKAWAGFLWAVWRAAKTKDEWKAHLLPLVWVGGLFLFMGTRWVKSIRYFLPIYPFLALFAAWAIYELWRKAEGGRMKDENNRASSFILHPSSLLAGVLFAIVTLGTLAWAWGFTSIYRTDNTRIQASRWIYQNIPAPFNLQIVTPAGATTEPLPFPEGMQISADTPYRFEFRPRIGGLTSAFTVGHARNAYDVRAPATLHVVLAADPDGKQPLAEADLRLQSSGSDERGDPASASLGPVQLQAGTAYYFLLTAPQGGPVNITGSTVSNEGWDEGLPLRLDGRDAFGGLYRGVEMSIHWRDDENKREMILNNLAQVDYIILPSQRRLWSASRMPATYPMTMEFYRALFDGRLGYDLAAQFQSPFVIGPLQVSDLVGAAAWGRAPDVPVSRAEPFNDSLLAAEEAFSVYDHAPVWIFKKRADFSLENARAVLSSIDLSKVVNQGPREATKAPTLLMLPRDRLEAQRAGGTWREMFDAESLLNKYQPLGVLAWYAALLVMGWLAFPLTYLVFGGLADRGYPLAKSVALLFVAWLVWMLGSYEALPFTRGTIALGFVVLAAISGVIFWRRRLEIGDYLRRNRRHILVVEGVALALFVFDLLIRLGNPDLWHPQFGGEKPMVFSFFNAVLKSTYFPPYDPWLAGGYINYYYYGFVIVAIPTKLLGIVPAFAYNLVLPMLFSLLGINAFCVAYNLVRGRKSEVRSQKSEAEGQKLEVGSWKSKAGNPGIEVQVSEIGVEAATLEFQEATLAETSSDLRPPTSNLQPPIPNAYLAGIAAALLVVVLGSLGQIWFLNRALQRAADPAVLAKLDPADYDFSTTLDGLRRVLSGKASLPGGGNWYWDATRIVTYTNQDRGEGGGNEINEFPYFTFLYADLHAHMMDMPFAVLALAWGAAYVLGVQRPRSRLESALMWLVGGLALGVTRPTNTWDFPTYLALGMVAVAAAHWMHDAHARITRANLFAVGGRLLLLAGLVMALYLPFDQWFVSPYSEVVRWKGSKTAVDTYLYIYGLFLFILATFLVWEARRWLAETPATVLTEARDWIIPAGLVPAALAAAVMIVIFIWNAAIAVITLPLMTWAGLLLLRSRAAMPPEKRVALFLVGTALALTLFVEMYAVGGDRMNTTFKLGIQAWVLLSVAAGAALAWVWAEVPGWTPNWRAAWTVVLVALAASAAFYTVTAASAKIKDRYPSYGAQPYGVESPSCQEIPDAPAPYPEKRSLRPEEQPHSLNGMDFMRWSAYCDNTYFLPLTYDYDAIRWMQDNVKGSPVVVEAQSFNLYRLSSRYAWYTGLPDVVGWDWHQRQERGALPTQFITDRGKEIEAFYCAGAGLAEEQLNPYPACIDAMVNVGLGDDWLAGYLSALQSPALGPEWAADFLQKYDARYVVVGPMERAYYPPQGLAKLDELAARGWLTVAYQNPGVTIYQVLP
jgi:YYY domain-containing protein